MKLLCSNCRGSNIETDPSQGNSFCADCGAVLEENAVVSEVTFAELSSGASVLQGQFVASEKGRVNAPSIFGRRLGPLSGTSALAAPAAAGSTSTDGQINGSALASSSMTGIVSESREVTLANGKRRLAAVAVALGLGDHHVEMAHRWFTLALQHQFTRGRRSNNIIASCLYIVCRLERTPHMLLDFSDILQTSVYSLGGTFLRLTQLLNLELPLVDPSFYIGRFASKLEFAEKTQQVVNSALRIAARMKRDWIVTGRRPAGVCAASLIVAARMHGFRRTERQVVRVVHICEATLKRRLNEFAATPSSQLSLEEFEGIWLEQECDPPSYIVFKKGHAASATPLEDSDSEIKGSLDAETINEISRLQAFGASSGSSLNEMVILTPPPSQNNTMISTTQISKPQLPENVYSDDGSLSDLDEDEEVAEMLLNVEEIEAKTQIWSQVNAEFLEAQAEIERIEQEKSKPEERPADDQIQNDENSVNAQNISDEKVKKPRKKRTKSSSSANINNTNNNSNNSSKIVITGEPVAETAAEAAKQAFSSKKLSKKINYEALESLLTTSASSKK